MKKLILLIMLCGGYAATGWALEEHTGVVLQSAATTTGNGTAVDVARYTTIGLDVVLSSGTGTVTFEGRTDPSASYSSIQCTNRATGTASTTAATTGNYQCSTAGLSDVRARISACSSCVLSVYGRMTTATSRSGGGGGTLTVQEEDGTPSTTASTLKFSNGTVTDNGGGSVSVSVTGGGAPTGATYIMQTADAGTSAEQALGALATGCLGSTTTTGVVVSRTLTGSANQITVTNGDCSGNPTLSIPTNPTLPGTVSATAFTATGASSGIVDINGVTSGKLRLTTADATAQTITISGAAQTTGASTLTIPDMAGVSDTFVFAAKSATLTNKSYDTEGTGNVFTYKKYKYIPMAGCNNVTAGTVWDLPTSNAAVPACRTGTNTQKGTLDFADGSSLSAQYHDMLTEDWTGVIDAVVVWESSTTTGDVVWQLGLACAGDGASDDPAFTDDVFTADTTKGTGNQYNMTASNTITTTGTCAASKIMHARLKRDSAHASDTMAGTARAVGLYLKLREAQ